MIRSRRVRRRGGQLILYHWICAVVIFQDVPFCFAYDIAVGVNSSRFSHYYLVFWLSSMSSHLDSSSVCGFKKVFEREDRCRYACHIQGLKLRCALSEILVCEFVIRRSAGRRGIIIFMLPGG